MDQSCIDKDIDINSEASKSLCHRPIKINLVMIKYWRILLVAICLSPGFKTNVFAQVTVSFDPSADAALFYDPNNYGAQYTNYGTYTFFKAEKYYTTCRSVIKFDLSSIPSTASIQSAVLYLYNTGSNAHVLSGSQSSLNRVTQNWTESSVVWYYFQYTTTGSINVPAATSTYQDYELDITNMVQSWVNGTYSNNGLLFKLNNETSGGALIFASREFTNASKRPKLVVTYIDKFSTSQTEGFEFATTQWNNTTGDNIDWNRDWKGTPSGVNGTGPSNATEGLYYTFLESSGFYSKSAYLLSPVFKLSQTDNANLSFDYHMYGTSMGSLTLNISVDGGTNWTSLWSKAGNQGNNWFHEIIDLDNYVGGNILLRFTGITGSSYLSDMALDNIKLSTNNIISPSEEQNYIFSTTPQSELGLSGPIQQSVQYFDGLGRLKQEVNAFSSPMGFDVVKPVVYDEFGRSVKSFLPYSDATLENRSSHGILRDEDWEDDLSNPQVFFYQNQLNLGTTNPFAYSRTVYEDSPLNRVLEQGAPGAVFQPLEENPSLSIEHTVKNDFQSNSISDNVFQLSVSQYGDLVNNSGYFVSGPNFYIYAPNELFKTITKNENWVITDGLLNTSEEFKDKQGQVVLKRSYTTAGKFDTYYVYDDFGLLRYVISPEGATKFETVWSCSKDDSKIKLWCYYYEYDARQRMVSKRLPGSEAVFMVYDDRDRLVLTQDGNQRLTNKWTFTKYDQLNRPIMTGIFTDPYHITQSVMQIFVNQKLSDPLYMLYEEPSSNSSTFYTENSFPKSTDGNGYQPYTLTFYDNYNFRSIVTGFSSLSFNQTRKIDTYSDTDGTSNGYFDNVKGLATGSKTLVMDGTTNNWVLAVNYYDNKYRLIQSHSTLYPVGTSMISSRYDFTGKVMETIEIQNVNTIENSIRTRFEYDHMSRLVNTFQYFNEQDPVLLAQNQYNELGELREKNLHSRNLNSFLQSNDYNYNIRGWLTTINDPDNLSTDNDYFGMKLFYETPDPTFGGGIGQFNGNISQVEWKHNNGTNVKGYNYAYDPLNRILSADYKHKVSGTWSSVIYFDVAGISYDFNGNIKTLKRKNSTGTQIDDLTYDYTGTGNQLNFVSDAGTVDGFNNRNTSGSDYEYDDNGNLTLDKNKSLRISYNYLNLPERVYPETTGSDEIKFIYDASGVKWQKVSNNTGVTTTTSYNHSFVYNGPSGSRVLDYVLTPEGMIKKLATPQYHYFVKDHLGNTRVTVYDSDADGILDQNTDEILQTANYYPFGMEFDGDVGGNNKYLYNGKEIQLDKIGTIGLDWYDYGARFYDPQLGRWHVPDPLCEVNRRWSPYRYAYNNPLRFVDPDGMLETVKPTDQASLNMIKNTLTVEDAQYVQLDEDGNIDQELINSHSSESGNFNNLTEMVNSDQVVEVSTNDNFNYVDENGNPGTASMTYIPSNDPRSPGKDSSGETPNGTTTGESGFMGKTLFPDKNGMQNSPDETIKLVINKNLSDAAKAEIYSHEGNGHALLYIRNGGDHKGASHQVVNQNGSLVDQNQTLKQMIISSKKETIINMNK